MYLCIRYLLLIKYYVKWKRIQLIIIPRSVLNFLRLIFFLLVTCVLCNDLNDENNINFE